MVKFGFVFVLYCIVRKGLVMVLCIYCRIWEEVWSMRREFIVGD